MRSNDIWLGTPYDMGFFTVLLQIVSKEVGKPAGIYCHTVGDLHLYEKYWDREVRYSGDYDYDSRAWDYTEESKETVNKMIDGEEPRNELLRELWRINNANRKKD